MLLIGDFNLPYINWKTWTTSSNDINNKENKFIESVRDSYLYQCVSQPTRYRTNEKSNILDLILVDNKEYIENIEHQCPLGKSNHDVLVFDYVYSVRKIIYTKTKYYNRKADFTSMKAELANVDWCSVLDSDNMDAIWHVFTDTVNKIVDTHVPIKKVKVNINKQFPLSKEQRENYHKEKQTLV